MIAYIRSASVWRASVALLLGICLASCTSSSAPAETEDGLSPPRTPALSVTEVVVVAPDSPLDFSVDSASAGFPQAPAVMPMADPIPDIPALLYFTFAGAMDAGASETLESERYQIWRRQNGESTLVAEVALPWNECLEMKLSPTGSHLACMTPRTLYVVGVNGQVERQVVHIEELAEFAASEGAAPPTVADDYWRADEPPAGFGTLTWLPDGERVLFSTHAGGFYQPLNDDLYLFDIAGGEVTRVFGPGQGGATLTLAPDGRFVAVVSPIQVQLLRTATLEVVNRWGYDATSYIENEPLYADLVWQGAKEGVEIAAVALIPPPIHERPWPFQQEVIDGSETQIWRIPVDGTSPAQIGIVPGRNLLRLSPKGNYVLYWTLLQEGRPIPGQYDQSIYGLHYLVVNTGEEGLVYAGTWMGFGGWLPDGKRFLLGEANEVLPARLVDLEEQVWRPWLAPHAPWITWPHGEDDRVSPAWLDAHTFLIHSGKSGQVWLETVDGRTHPLFETDKMILNLYFDRESE